MRRRQFLRGTAGALGLAALGKTAGEWPVGAADDPAGGNAKDLAALEKLIAPMEPDGPKYLSVPRQDGRFLNLLVRMARARNILEIGAAHGYFAIWMGAGLEETDGHLTTLEILADRVEMARKHVGQAGLSHRITFKEGDAHQLVPALEGPFDLVFLNADKSGLVDYFQRLFPKKLSPGAILVAWGAIQQRAKMKEYLDLVGSHPDFDTVVLSATMEDGFAVSARKRKGKA